MGKDLLGVFRIDLLAALIVIIVEGRRELHARVQRVVIPTSVERANFPFNLEHYVKVVSRCKAVKSGLLLVAS